MKARNYGNIDERWQQWGRWSSLALICLAILSLVVACGEVSPTSQVGTLPTITPVAPTLSGDTTTVATTVPANTTTTGLPDTTSPATDTTSMPTVTPEPTTIVVTTVAATETTTAATTTQAPTPVPVPPTTTVAPPIPTTVISHSAPTVNAKPTPKAATAKTVIFTQKNINGTITLKVGDTLLANFGTGLDWSFQVTPSGSILSGPLPASPPYQASFKALSAGNATIQAYGKCHPEPGKMCFNAIPVFNFNIVVS